MMASMNKLPSIIRFQLYYKLGIINMRWKNNGECKRNNSVHTRLDYSLKIINFSVIIKTISTAADCRNTDYRCRAVHLVDDALPACVPAFDGDATPDCCRILRARGAGDV